MLQAATLSLPDAEGTRYHTVYVAAAPEYGKTELLQRLEREIDRLKARYPHALYLGIADGPGTHWTVL